MPPVLLQKRTLTLACRNISAGVKVSLSFRGEADGSMPEALKTSNRDIGVMIKDMQGNVIRPQSGRLPIDNFQYPNQSGSSRISIYPINTTGQLLPSGSSMQRRPFRQKFNKRIFQRCGPCPAFNEKE